ncbi:DUF4124 domain-containing protein [Xanthomonas campestris pv. campestris]|uniref:DUF4124 domain-containing protein n=1 Tax=Xanthomonas campestris TaxID=339 RepID=UPI001260DC95|nr:DUF4124 domain-containing protein [Xanthomonas campestris]MDO0828334.1 DUF4124 domain-containing protein [Xanthomonas campestris pv. campestris]MEB1076733.1 DUF4124 domain-containing protein [Xanthomonas campestris pv. campestris]MEB1405986.1 DUF4124 domain-containing protein [Xanthomonas campestris pv. campestris]MEB1426955.1 DUF4124 domain-containing protein [Xanthomonas campestris pv. campestris]MEB1521480.1 DUF4124 domain-containing protein [Xanthomonas campestris pv. campestris]
MSRWGWVMLVLAPTASAQEVAIYRCTDAQGALTVQNMPCPKGMQQQKKLMTAPATMPLPSSAAAPVSARSAPARAATQAPPAAAPAPQAPAAVPTATTATSSLPPPPLFECTAHDNGRYFTEDSEPATRCLPMQVTNLAGGPAQGGGSACEVVTDRCAPVPDQSLYAAWRQRAEQAEAAWRFSDEAQSAARKQRYDQARRVMDESRCAGTPATP